VGRRPQPAQLKLLNGRGNGKDSAGRPVNLGPAFVRQAPDPPSWLEGEALAEWRRIVPELDRLRMLSGLSRSSLTAYCVMVATHSAATAVIAREGLMVTTARGPRPHPALAVQRAAGAELRRWAVEFGLTPASEQRIPTAGLDEQSEDFD